MKLAPFIGTSPRTIPRKINQRNDGQAAVIDSYAMTAIWKHKFGRIRVDPMAHTVIVGIVNENHHWMLVVMCPHEKKTLFLDPLGEGKGKTKVCLQSTRAFMWMKGCKVSGWTCSTLPHNRQQDSTSCGVLALKFAENILLGEAIEFETSQKAVHELRLDIATSLLRESDDLSRLCFYCGMEEQDEEHWVISYCTLQIKKISRNMFPDFINITFALVIATIFGIFSIN
ncbi:uncharacterized protein LOC117561740 isoform X1 [Gymnodraco acuticeps]|uniref:Uncharacterized protein LOC117561740 isoform X1 n=1 Tax=Gymnodraco acuticeps TaxID=8218 RepID=A0A6P8X5D3_GYMAC|nr:uncharacterized protein LOC117561740 isoform X1 [Gymnodraco acuticeps]